MDSLQVLKYNLHEIHIASSMKGGQLVSNLQGTRVYFSSTGWGRLWTWFYVLTKPFFKDDLRLSNLRATIKNIEDVFLRELNRVRLHAATYEEYLRICFNFGEAEEGDYHEARRGIIDWRQATKTFLKEKSLRNEIELCAEYIPNGDPIPLFLQAPEKLISNLGYIIKIEGKQEGPLPLDLIYKEVTGQKMAKREVKSLGKWISQFQKVRHLHKLLVSLSPFISNSDIVKFELNLVLSQCPLFIKPDPRHLRWREALKLGTNLGDYTLGKQLGKKGHGFDSQILFETQEDSEKLIMISTNRSLLKLKEAFVQEGGWGLKTPVFEYIDPKGRFAVIERFKTVLADINWSSTNVLLPADQKMAEPIANYIQWLFNNNMSVSQLNPKYVMFDKEGILRSVKIQERSFMDYPALEGFLFEVSKGNPAVFQYMMHQSGLMNSKHAAFYRYAVKESLMNGIPDMIDCGANHSMGDRRDIEKALDLCFNMLKLQKRLVIECRIDKQTAAKILLQVYHKSQTAGTFLPTLYKEARDMIP